jgi:putative heme iron utilization protein
MTVSGAHLNGGGFARAMGGPAASLLTAVEGAEVLIEAEAEALDQLNHDHADSRELYARRLAHAPAGAWRAIGLDPEGLDLMAGDRTLRIPFPAPVTNPAALRRVLKDLADRARAP